MSESKHNRIRFLTLAAVLCALVFVSTAYLPRIPLGAGGYVHIGDAFIYLAASLLPLPYACAVGAIGAGLADALTGFIIYTPGTALIKAAMAFFFTYKNRKILCARNLTAVIPAGAVCVVGYYLYDVILARSFAAPLAWMWGNVLQAAASAVIFVVIGFVFDRFNLKSNISK